MPYFWSRTVRHGRLSVSLVRNQFLQELNRQFGTKQKRVLFEVLDGQVFFTLRIGAFYLNIDWVP